MRADPIRQESLLGTVLASSLLVVVSNEISSFRHAPVWVRILLVVAGTAPLAWLLTQSVLPWISSLGADRSLPAPSRGWTIATAVLAALLLVVFPARAAVAVVIAQWVVLTTALLFLGAWLVRPVAVQTPVQAWEGWGHAALPLLVWSSWLWAFAPGLLSSDSIDQWMQAGSGRINDFHPMTHTVLLRGVRQLWDSPAAVAVLQILSIGALAGWALRELRLSGLRRAWTWLSACLLAFLPVFATHVITIWKDIPFAAAILGITTVLFRAASGRPLRLHHWALLVGLTALGWLVRHNGAPLLLGVVIALALILPRGRRMTTVWVVLAVLALALGSKQWVTSVYGGSTFTKEIALIGFLGSHVSHETELTDDEAAILNALHPLESRWNYSCFSNVPTVWGGGFKPEALDRHAAELTPLTVRLTLRNPWPVVSHVLCASSMLWEIHPKDAPLFGSVIQHSGEHGVESIHLVPNGPTPDFPSLEVAKTLSVFVNRSLSPALNWIFWRPALATWLLIIGCFFACRRAGSLRAVVPLIPAIVHTGALAVFITAPDVRYQFGVVLIAAIYGVGYFGGAQFQGGRAMPHPDGVAAPLDLTVRSTAA